MANKYEDRIKTISANQIFGTGSIPVTIGILY